MGIRFECPNGHKLHVKSFLAGKRGICPDCGAKFIIPPASDADSPGASGIVLVSDESQETSDEAREPLPHNENDAASASSPAAQTASVATVPQEDVGSTAAPEKVPPVADTAAPPIAQPEQARWFVRPQTGGQFGPATDEALKSWIVEGRVTEDSLMWCNGWPEWKPARDVAEQLPIPLVPRPATPETAVPVPVAAEPPPASAAIEEPSESPLPTEAASAEVQATQTLARRRRAQQQRLTVTWVLLLAVIVLAGLLIWVLVYGAGQPSTSQPSTTRPSDATQLVQSLQGRYVADAAGAT